MSSAISAAVVVGAASIYGAKKSGDAADRSIDASENAAKQQAKIADEQLALSREQWDLYKTNIFPLEQEAQELGISAQELAQQRGELDLKAYEDYYLPLQEQFVGEAAAGIEADPKRAAREARMNVDQAFDSAEGSMTRDLQRRGVRPDSGAYDQDISLNRAAASGMAVNSAIEGERDRVEDVNFNRKATVLGRQPLAANPTQGPGSPGITAGVATAGMGAAGRTAYGAGQQYGSSANLYGNAAGGAASSAIQLGTAAYDMYNKYAAPSTPYAGGGGYAPVSAPVSQWGGGGGGGNYASAITPNQTNGLAAFNEGGPVNAPELGRAAYGNGGEVNGPPGVDQVPAYIEGSDGGRAPARLTDNEYVIPADVVEIVGTGPLEDIIMKARDRKQKAAGQNALARTGGR
jgi:hypothetical protein